MGVLIHIKTQMTAFHINTKKYHTEKTEQIRSQSTYDDQQWWHTDNTGGGLTI